MNSTFRKSRALGLDARSRGNRRRVATVMDAETLIGRVAGRAMLSDPSGAPLVLAAPSRVLMDAYGPLLVDLTRRTSPVSVCDVGGGRNPQFSLEEIDSLDVAYTVLDISSSELAAAPAGYETLEVDICAVAPELTDEFDLLFTRMLLEHVDDGRQAHESMIRLLRPGGLAVHLFPTLPAVPFVVNRVVPEAIADRLLDLFAPRDRTRNDKFRAYYSWTWGPTARQLERLRSVGFEVVAYVGGFGHGYYQRIPGIRTFAPYAWNVARERGWPLCTSFALVVLRRPTESELP